MKHRSVLVTGGNGMLAQAVVRVLTEHGTQVIALARSELDVTDSSAVRETLARLRPSVVVQCAAFTRVDDSETEAERAFAVNAEATTHVAAACAEIEARLVYPSTDYVFDGKADRPYPPDAAPSPINVYGRSKLAGEQAARAAGDVLIVRTSWLYGRGGRNFVRTVVDRLRRNEPIRVVADQHGAPTRALDAARAVAALLSENAPPGTYHFTSAGTATWYELACEVAHLIGSKRTIEPCSTAEYPTPAARPKYAVLDCRATEAIIGSPRNWREALTEALSSGDY